MVGFCILLADCIMIPTSNLRRIRSCIPKEGGVALCEPHYYSTICAPYFARRLIALAEAIVSGNSATLSLS